MTDVMTAFADPDSATSAGPKPPDTVVRGPEHADNYRIPVGRFRERWYRDPLPYCELAPEALSDESYPSVSSVKGASGKDWTFVSLKRIAKSPDLSELATKGFYERYERFKVINQLDLSAAMRRGTNVHTRAECHAYGVPQYLGPGVEGAAYFDTVDRLFTDLNPELVAAEFVCIHRTMNGVGYGGTSDGIFKIDGKFYMVDWKSRGEDSNHGAYPEEAGQIGAYTGAEYIIVADDDPSNPHGAKRMPMPKLDGGLIVSIKPDSYEVYPIDLPSAIDHFEAQHAWWLARRTENKAIGPKWAPRRTVPMEQQLEESIEAIEQARKAKLYARLDGLTKPQRREFDDRVAALDPSDLAAIDRLMTDIENPPTILESARARMDTDAKREADRRLALEGGTADEEDVKLVSWRWDHGMSNAARNWTGQVVQEANAAKLEFRLSSMSSQRRVDLYCALTEWVSLEQFDPDDDSLFRAVIATFSEDDLDEPIGVLVGQLSTEEAAVLRSLVTKIGAGEMTYVVPADADAAPRWEQLTSTTSES